ncbi:MAG: helix-turn-helix domain-containing protein [Candidatus Saccharimonadales bacterium]
MQKQSASSPSNRRSNCPIAFSLDLFGDRWTLLILRDMLFYNKTRFSDFAVVEGISTNILAERLVRLERAGLITRQQDDVLKNQNIYRATDTGWSLAPVLLEMAIWGLQHDKQTSISKAFIQRLKIERDEVVSEIINAVASGEFERYQKDNMGL